MIIGQNVIAAKIAKHGTHMLMFMLIKDNKEYKSRYKNTEKADDYTFFDYNCPKGENIVETWLNLMKLESIIMNIIIWQDYTILTKKKGILFRNE